MTKIEDYDDERGHVCPQCGEHFNRNGEYTDDELVQLCPVRHGEETCH